MAIPPPALVDTNTIFECHWTGCWAALSGGRSLETVEACIVETQTGAHKRPSERRINEVDLRASLTRVHQVTALELAELALRGGPYLDEGERALWALALSRSDSWVLCGPDGASMRMGVHLGLKDRLISLEELCASVGARPTLRRHFTKSWLNECVVRALLNVN